MDQDRRTDVGQDREADLLARTRTGDDGAYAELWQRYAQVAKVVARTYWWSADSDDLVAESFTRIYQALRAGKGPTSAFKPYLFATMRNLAVSWGRARRELPIEHIDAVEDPASTETAADDRFDAMLVSKALLALPDRWQQVLWLAEVEDLSMQEIGERLDISEGAAGVLAFRAREGLRQAWIAAHLSDRPPSAKECRWTLGKLGGHARRRLTARDERRVRAHLEQCAPCRASAEEARRASSRILSVLLPGAVALGAGVQKWQAFTAAAAAVVASLMPATVTLPVAGLTTAKAGLVAASLVTTATLVLGLAATLVRDQEMTAVPVSAVETAPATSGPTTGPLSGPTFAPVPTSPAEPPPMPLPRPSPIPEPAPIPVPDPIPEPDPAPIPAPGPIRELEPVPVPEPEPAPAPKSEPAPPPAPVPQPAPEPAPAPRQLRATAPVAPLEAAPPADSPADAMPAPAEPAPGAAAPVTDAVMPGGADPAPDAQDLHEPAPGADGAPFARQAPTAPVPVADPRPHHDVGWPEADRHGADGDRPPHADHAGPGAPWGEVPHARLRQEPTRHAESPRVLDIPAHAPGTQRMSASVRCEAGTDLTVRVLDVTAAAGRCGGSETWEASIDVSSIPVPPGTAVTLVFTQTDAAGISCADSVDVVLTDGFDPHP